MKKRQRKVRLIRAAIQLVFFIFYPALFSTAFAGIKSVFQALAAHQPITWNSFLDVTGVLLVITILFGRHFCCHACEVTCPRKNIQIGPVKVRETEKNEK